MAGHRAEYPAAHSMDTDWFAVDLNGHVAHFDSGEGGALPTSSAFAVGISGGYLPGQPYMAEDALIDAALSVRARWDDRLAAMLPDDAEQRQSLVRRLEYWYRDESLAALGVRVYDHEEQYPVPYSDMLPIERPLLVDDLDRATADLLRDGQLPIVFDDHPRVQPAELVACRFWRSKDAWAGVGGEVFDDSGEPVAPEDPRYEGIREVWQREMERDVASDHNRRDRLTDFYEIVAWAADPEAKL